MRDNEKERERERGEKKGGKKRTGEKNTTNLESQSAGVTMHDIIQYPSNTY